MRLTVFIKVPKQHLLIGELLMVFKMIETMFENLVIDAVFILVRLVGLLPAKIQEQILLLINLLPLFTSG